SSFVNVSGIAVLKDDARAIELVRWLLGADAQRALSTSTFEYPLAAGVPPAAGLLPLGEVRTPEIDYSDLSALRDETERALGRLRARTSPCAPRARGRRPSRASTGAARRRRRRPRPCAAHGAAPSPRGRRGPARRRGSRRGWRSAPRRSGRALPWARSRWARS